MNWFRGTFLAFLFLFFVKENVFQNSWEMFDCGNKCPSLIIIVGGTCSVYVSLKIEKRQAEWTVSLRASSGDKQARVGLGLMPEIEEESAILLDTQASVLHKISNKAVDQLDTHHRGGHFKYVFSPISQSNHTNYYHFYNVSLVNICFVCNMRIYSFLLRV